MHSWINRINSILKKLLQKIGKIKTPLCLNCIHNEQTSKKMFREVKNHKSKRKLNIQQSVLNDNNHTRVLH